MFSGYIFSMFVLSVAAVALVILAIAIAYDSK
jgi:NADH:ubiquinone oxidoreductase subunit K